jgi:PAB1-binding protein PBP1
MKRSTWITAISIAALSLALVLGSCAKAPQAEVDAARSAVAAAAQNGDVPVYAPDTLKRAQDSLSTMEAELKAKRYDKTKLAAVDAKENADKSLAEAAVAKEAARVDAKSLLDELATSLPAAEKTLAAAQKVRKAKLDFKALATMLASAKSTVAGAKADFDAGSYGPARDKAIGAKTSLADLTRQISEGIQAATKKK